MNNLLHTVAACAIATLAVACTNENDLGDVTEVTKPTGTLETITLTAYQSESESNTNNGSTRIAFDKDGKAYWHAGDTIGVWSNGEKKFKPFVLVDGAGTATASFRGDVVDGAGSYALYPYNKYSCLLDSAGYARHFIGHILPDHYTYEKVDQTFFPEGNDGNSFCMPMYGTVSEDNVVSFKHVGGVVCIMIDKMPSASGTVSVKSLGLDLWGLRPITIGTEVMKFFEINHSYAVVTFNYSNATEGAKGVFYLPVAPGIYDLTIQVSGGDKWSSMAASVEVQRTWMQAVNVTTKYHNDGVDNSKTINGHKFVDLGLPSHLLWAETNIGAETAADAGNYYAWGETTTKKTYADSTYKYYDTSSSKFTKYTSTKGKTVLENSDDAAYVNWGSSCRMPAACEFEELRDTTYCKWTWTSRTNSSNETINGYEVTSKKNGNSIFLPASGRRSGSNLEYHGSNGWFWSSTLRKFNEGYTCTLNFGSGSFISDFSRYDGLAVRPVAEP